MGYQYVLFYKPYNVLSQFSAGSTPPAPGSAPRLTLKDFIPIADVYPVGRLDFDSEGLMLLTNHGRVQHRLSEPRFGHPRTYWAQVEQVPTQAALAQLRQGVSIKGYRTRPCQVERLAIAPPLPDRDPPIRYRQRIPTAWLAITLQEGKNRQVRRMTAAVGHPTLRLVRQAIAHLRLGELQPGQWRHATAAEQRWLQQL
ncbi:pseudouridine synthase [Nodosilinea sp. PGN35]|uniref:pseudouridine synthase n=1 Tax=Nodosilinea sp. PGN35 TaxID=3020489 RepID=UPI0023B28802|nr:pseudouridine synthase [Nodosilinea sp. TSF1-S3]MDF0365730.1 pseudouridine synthase [Nodosilinea sp. TSF1-S3]